MVRFPSCRRQVLNVVSNCQLLQSNKKVIPKDIIKQIFILTIIGAFGINSACGQDTLRTKQVIKEWLTVPFGTIAKMNIEIVDGNELNDKGHQGSFLFKVNSVDSIPLSKPILIEFKDETGHFPSDEFELYKHLYGKKTGTISPEESELMKKKYVGKQFNIVAYEAGEFTGIPGDYFKYQPIRQDYGFYFRHYIIVVSNLTKRTK
jgi:hypothetical protein